MKSTLHGVHTHTTFIILDRHYSWPSTTVPTVIDMMVLRPPCCTPPSPTALTSPVCLHTPYPQHSFWSGCKQIASSWCFAILFVCACVLLACVSSSQFFGDRQIFWRYMVHIGPFREVERPRQDFKRSFQAIQLHGLGATLGWSYHRIPNVLTIATLQAGLRPVEAQFGGFSDPERTTGGFRRDICVLTASPEGSLDSFEELGVLSHHLV